MVCGAGTLSISSFNNDLAQDPLLALQLIDGRGIPVNQLHLNELKRLNQKIEFSKLAVTGAGIPGGPGAFSWISIESTMTRGESWDDLGVCITGLMKFIPLESQDTFISFAGGDFAGTLLVGENNIYVATIKHQQIPGPNAAISATVPTLITNVKYIPEGFLDYVEPFEPFDNAKAVVVKALGAVAAGYILDIAQSRLENQSIRQAIEGMPQTFCGYDYNVLRVVSGMGGLAPTFIYIKSKKSWKISPKDAGVPECKKIPNYSRSVLESDLSTSLEKIRKKVDGTELQRSRPAQLPSAQDRFEMLKVIAANLAEMVAGVSDAASPGFGLPTSFIEGLSDLKTSLFKETPAAYTVQAWDAKIESYINQFGDAVDVMLEYHGGLFKQLTAIEQAQYYILPPTVEEVIDPVALQGAADRLSKIAIMKGKLIHIGRLVDVDGIGRGLRYSYKTGRVKINGKRQNLTMVKIKEQGSKAVYLAFNPNPRRFTLPVS